MAVDRPHSRVLAGFTGSPGLPIPIRSPVSLRGAARMTTLNLTLPVFDFGLIRALRTVGRNIGRFFGSIAAAQQAASDFERINARTDAQLAAGGLRRTDIARVVFERHFD